MGAVIVATVSGSFHRFMPAISEAVSELRGLGVRVLSPTEPRIVSQLGEFLFVASDRVRVVHLVQNRHLEAIRSSDFLYLVAPDGYVGVSAAMEIGFAVAVGVPVVCLYSPKDSTLLEYVHVVASLRSWVDVNACLTS